MIREPRVTPPIIRAAFKLKRHWGFVFAEPKTDFVLQFGTAALQQARGDSLELKRTTDPLTRVLEGHYLKPTLRLDQ